MIWDMIYATKSRGQHLIGEYLEQGLAQEKHYYSSHIHNTFTISPFVLAKPRLLCNKRSAEVERSDPIQFKYSSK